MCFHGETVVSKEDGSSVKMRDLVVGDRILVLGTDQATLIWSIVLAIDTYQLYDTTNPIEYLVLNTTFGGPALHITPEHSLLIRKHDEFYPRFVFAREVQVEDSMYVADSRLKIREVPVTSITKKLFYDAYAPLVFEGNLLVNNAVVSAYGSFSHALAHYIIKAPRRWWLYLGSALIERQTFEKLDRHITDIMVSMITGI